ncbi:hypothetical protein J2Z76_003287 [Sedimentibacter acidaminivorans]|uniref:Antitoxin VbhA domain-containing protein n=1 Tax=Sedimentibacter acidaminivorans TaxID=913099 RepID=A0ABS4GI62_9FIRM|nr:hypothetical protein [Sedimentibacter acidaminivorans]MBP1927386.1 hypothetical protein [Sedimentibacter acidaminivorans]
MKKANDEEGIYYMNSKEIDKIINNVDGNLAIEGMPLTEQDRDRIRICLSGKVAFNDMIKHLVEKHTVKGC